MTAGTPLTLTGTINPANATNTAIVWTVKNVSSSAIGATISGNTLSVTASGTVVVTATIANGLAAGLDYTQDFSITVNAPPVVVSTYNVSLISFTNGIVSVDKTVNIAAGETVTITTQPDNGYELNSLFAYETGNAAISVNIMSTSTVHIYQFTMPACNVTVEAVFSTTQESLDREALEAAIAAIEREIYNVPQEYANDVNALKEWLANKLDQLGYTSVIDNISILSNTPAVKGAATTPTGKNGSFQFTVTLTIGTATGATDVISGTIIATQSTVTGIDKVAQSPSLKAFVLNGKLHISGLTAGKLLYVYHISGMLIHRHTGTGEEVEINLPTRGIYIVVSEKESVKTVY
jgi:hypothetical protein